MIGSNAEILQKRLDSCGLRAAKWIQTFKCMNRTLAVTSKSQTLQATATAALKAPAKTANLAETPSYLGNVG